MTEGLLAADVERDVRRHLAPLLLQEADKPAEMVVMPMTDDQRPDRRWVDAQDLHVVEQRLGRVTEIDHRPLRLAAEAGFDEKREAPLVVEDAREFATAGSLNLDAADLLGRKEGVVSAVHEHTDRKRINFRYGDRRRTRWMERRVE